MTLNHELQRSLTDEPMSPPMSFPKRLCAFVLLMSCSLGCRPVQMMGFGNVLIAWLRLRQSGRGLPQSKTLRV
jgi:hypothetical protein